MSAPVGIVGRFVSCEVKRGDLKEREVCEVVACQTGGDYGSWKIMLATHDGSLIDVSISQVKLIPTPSDSSGPYR
jgi:hypothetical protein